MAPNSAYSRVRRRTSPKGDTIARAARCHILTQCANRGKRRDNSLGSAAITTSCLAETLAFGISTLLREEID